MPAGAPWSVKGIDPKARAIAKSAARTQGMTLGEWLNRVILDDGSGKDSDTLERSLSEFPGFGGGGGGGTGDDEIAQALAATVKRLTDKLEAAENRSQMALSGVDQSMLNLTRRLESLELSRDASDDQSETALARIRTEQDDLLERIRKIERTGSSGANADTVDALENAMGKIAGRVFETEQHVRAELDEAKHTHQRQKESIERSIKTLSQQLAESERKAKTEATALRDMVETRQGRVDDNVAAVQTFTRSLQSRILEAESATQQAAEALTRSQESLHARLNSLETNTRGAIDADDVQKQFNAFGQEIAGLIRETRADCARQIAEVQLRGGDPARLERALDQAENRLRQAEGRQNSALERIAGEVARLSRAVDQRIAQAERRLENKMQASDVRRDRRDERQDLESRLDRVRSENHDAVREIGAQVAKLGESLADRVSQAELRSAQAVEAAGERMAQVVERLEDQRQNTTESDLDERIRASEQRTAERIDQAMQGVHTRLDEAREDTQAVLSPVQRALHALADRLEAIENERLAPAAAPEPIVEPTVETEPQTETAVPAIVSEDPVIEPADPSEIDFSEPLPEAPRLDDNLWTLPDDDPIAKPDSFVVTGQAPQMATETPSPQPVSESKPAPEPPVQPRPEPKAERTAPTKPKAQIGATADADFLAAARKSVRQPSIADQWSDERKTGSVGFSRKALIGASVLGLVAVTAAAAMLVIEATNGRANTVASAPAAQDPAEALNALFADEVVAAPAQTVPTQPTEAEQTNTSAPEPVAANPEPTRNQTSAVNRAATPQPQTVQQTQSDQTARTPTRTAPAAPPRIAIETGSMSLEQAASSGDAVARYLLAVQHAQAGRTADATALMRRAAEQGIPDAMRRHAQNLLNGPGAARNRNAAIAWMTRAAQAGNVVAMHEAGGLNIANDDPQSQREAARWFEQGALHGNRDSQFNIALLFQEGFGVEQSLADAYAWLSIAARNGDRDAAGRAQALVGQLTPEQRQAAEQVAASFRPRPVDPAAQGQYSTQSWRQSPQDMTRRAQQLLAELGYNPGPADGIMGNQTRQAIVRYQQSVGIAPGSPLNTALIAQLERATN